MFRKCLLTLAGLALFTLPTSAQTVDELIAKHITARGGMDKLKAAKTMRLTGKLTVGPGMEAPFTLELKRPKNMRMEFTFQGMTGIQGFDGTTAWMVMPFMGKKDPERVPDEEAKETAEQADFDGPLVDHGTKGHKVELMGKDKVEGTDAYKLKVTLKSGDVRYIYLDAEYFLEIKSEGRRTVRGTEQEFESSLGDYKEVEGLVLPHAMEGGAKGSPMKQKMTIEKVEVNPAIDDARFKMPEVKPEPKPEDKPKS